MDKTIIPPTTALLVIECENVYANYLLVIEVTGSLLWEVLDFFESLKKICSWRLLQKCLIIFSEKMLY